jgi:hypothetical protein
MVQMVVALLAQQAVRIQVVLVVAVLQLLVMVEQVALAV